MHWHLALTSVELLVLFGLHEGVGGRGVFRVSSSVFSLLLGCEWDSPGEGAGLQFGAWCLVAAPT